MNKHINIWTSNPNGITINPHIKKSLIKQIPLLTKQPTIQTTIQLTNPATNHPTNYLSSLSLQSCTLLPAICREIVFHILETSPDII